MLSEGPPHVRIGAMTAKDGKVAVVLREIGPKDWPLIVELFGSRGACGGCWCMHWRREKGGQAWEQAKGEPNRRAFRKLVESGQAHGIIALRQGQRLAGVRSAAALNSRALNAPKPTATPAGTSPAPLTPGPSTASFLTRMSADRAFLHVWSTRPSTRSENAGGKPLKPIP